MFTASRLTMPIEPATDLGFELVGSTSANKTENCVSVSSPNWETYAAASAVMDAILIRTILCWVLQIRILTYLYLDSSAARGVLSRRGVGRLRHLSCCILRVARLGKSK